MVKDLLCSTIFLYYISSLYQLVSSAFVHRTRRLYVYRLFIDTISHHRFLLSLSDLVTNTRVLRVNIALQWNSAPYKSTYR